MSNSITGTGTNLGFELEVESNPFAQVFAEYEKKNGSLQKIKVGSKVTGILTHKNDKYALVDVRGKSAITIDNSGHEKLILNNIEVGDEVTVMITDLIDGADFEVTGSLYQLKMLEIADFMDDAYDDRTVLTGVPVELNHAGYNVVVNIDDQQVSLFMPHLLTDVNKLPNPESILNTEIEFLLEHVSKEGQSSYIASRKAYLFTLANKELRNIKKKTQYTGFITGSTDFAVFVQFNTCLTGMIHKTNLSPELAARLDAPTSENRIKPGEEISFYVKDVIKNKLFLTQVLRDSLWDSIAVNQEHVGTVFAIKDYGVMVDLDFETKGLLHKSVLLNHTENYKVGDKVRVIVTQVNKNNRQITLALK